ncbi:MAG: hypothetical protein QNK37_06505 [Acidobacteriota bacterium]|nr:hypothetical protein [Acidobacteriota bacterium]
MTRKIDFLGYFYRAFLVCGLAGTAAALLIGGRNGVLSFFLGFVSIGFILYIWHRITAQILKPRKARLVLESFLFFVRFGLIAGLFYAMIRLFAVSPGWYAAGLTMLLPAMVFAGFAFDGDAEVNGTETKEEG